MMATKILTAEEQEACRPRSVADEILNLIEHFQYERAAVLVALAQGAALERIAAALEKFTEPADVAKIEKVTWALYQKGGNDED